METRRGAGQVVVNTGEMILDKESESGLSDYEREAEFEVNHSVIHIQRKIIVAIIK